VSTAQFHWGWHLYHFHLLAIQKEKSRDVRIIIQEVSGPTTKRQSFASLQHVSYSIGEMSMLSVAQL